MELEVAVHNSTSLDRTLRQLNPIQNLIPCFFNNIHFIVILPFTSMTPKYMHFSSPPYVIYAPTILVVDLNSLITFGEEYKL